MQYITGAAGDGNSAQPAQRESMQEETASEPLEKQESTGCVFCDRLRDDPANDRRHLVLLRGKRNFIILNLYPYNSAHLMVVPNEHTADFTSLDGETTGEMTAFFQWMLRVIAAEYSPQGFNMGMNIGRVSGAGVADHVHMHIVPRWAGDTNFMPIVGATKVMPEMLETTYDRLKARMEATP